MIKKSILLIAFILYLIPCAVFGADYEVPLSDSNLDINGQTVCGGVCDSDDTITIAGGTRTGNIEFMNFDGGGTYIKITHDGVSQVVINPTGSTTGAIILNACKYVDLDASGLGGETYGFHINNGNNNDVRVKGESDHIKISYIEMEGGGILVNDGANMDETWIWDTIEVHHNYIHDTWYSGMYLGQNDPPFGDPYTSNVSVHDNLLEDLGSYGLVVKGVHSTSAPIEIYNNTIRRTGLNYCDYAGEPGCNSGIDLSEQVGISVHTTYGASYSKVYNNWIEKTAGAGIKIAYNIQYVYNNIIVGCGTLNDTDWGHGIVTYYGSDGVQIYDNIIIQPTRYGIYALGGADANGTTLSRNLIGDAGIGEWGGASGKIIESASPNANIYEADVADFNFNTWSDDSDYSNDRFRTRDLNPDNNDSGFALGGSLTWTNFGDVTGVDVYFDKTTNPPTTKVIDNADVEIYTPPADLDGDSTYNWRIVTYGGVETGAVYSFYTGPGPPIVAGESLSGIVNNAGAGRIGINAAGPTIANSP